MPLVVKAKGDKKKSPHLALTHMELQNGASNGRNVSLLMKSDVEIDEDTALLIEKVAGVKVEVNKASYEHIRNKLQDAVKKFETKGYDWSWIIDFDESNVVFSNDSGMFYTTYSVNGLEVGVGSEATEVSRVVNYVESGEKIVLSEALETIDGGVRSLIVKSFDNISKNEKLVNVIKQLTKTEKENSMTEIEKAVEDATNGLKVELEKSKSDLQKAQADLTEALEKVQSFEKAAQEQKESIRKSAVSGVLADEKQVEEFLKSVSSLDDNAFNSVVEVLKAKSDVVEDSDLFTKSSTRPAEVTAEENALKEMLQKKYSKE